MHFLGAGLSHHLDDLGRGGAAHDGIVDQDDPLALDIGAVGIVLQLDAEMADLVGRLDEGAADIMVADDAELEGNATLGGIADRSEEHTSELQSLMRISYAVFCLKKKNHKTNKILNTHTPPQYPHHPVHTYKL